MITDSTELKNILWSKRANIYYLEKCRIMQKDGRVLYLKEDKKNNTYWNIPIANTTSILLGIGTSITHAAVRMLISAGVMIGFCGSGGTPLFAGSEIEWISPQSEYRPTEYMQNWMLFWFDDNKRLDAAKEMQKMRCNFLISVWSKNTYFIDKGFGYNNATKKILSEFMNNIDSAKNVTDLLLYEARYTKQLYKYAARTTETYSFTRDPNSNDYTNKFLSHGNYLAYGMAATTLWALGISFAFALMHGKTRRGALVFDIADLVKDSIILPLSFICAQEDYNDKEFRQFCIQKLVENNCLDFMFDCVKKISLSYEKK